MKQEYKRVSAGYYVSDTGGKIAIKPVNREYAGRVKKPVYFASKYNPATKKYVYLSGFFRTKEPGVFSWDLKDEFGIKVLQVCLFSEGGETITLMTMDEYKRGIAA
jgi:hypothetical protein